MSFILWGNSCSIISFFCVLMGDIIANISIPHTKDQLIKHNIITATKQVKPYLRFIDSCNIATNLYKDYYEEENNWKLKKKKNKLRQEKTRPSNYKGESIAKLNKGLFWIYLKGGLGRTVKFANIHWLSNWRGIIYNESVQNNLAQ